MSYELRIDALAFGGRGVGRHQGKAVFVPYTAPGDLIRCRSVREHKRYNEGVLVELLMPGAGRVTPRCELFGRCGGCQWQHLDYPRQLEAKRQLHLEQLQRTCGVASEQVLATLAADPAWFYRSRAQFKCYQAKDGFVLGFYRSGSHFVIDLEQCPVCHPRINALLPALKQTLAASVEPQRIPQVDVATGDDGRLRVVVHYIGRQRERLIAQLEAFADEHAVSVLLQSGRKESLVCLAGEPLLDVEPLPGLPLAYAAGGFAQVHLAQNRALVGKLCADVGTLPGRILDLFCGMGNFTLPLARHGAAIVGLEGYRPSILRARENAQRHGLDVTFEVADCEGDLEGFWGDVGFDCVVLDPPRSGAQTACRLLARRRPPRIVYVSCDSATLARDLKVLLGHGYRIEASTPIDMFPQTSHIESVTLLTLS
ncbi:MAG: 23S rRNA (uracil(1939)-C(5))-methyltransferase RlmD [Desulfuromonas sp.]|nr:MAG: 23S rRNA (uracil(1939)-C(5))-methyltransferase RlmD [Desulfuromonas sp.]